MCLLGVLRLFEVEDVGVLEGAVKPFEVLGQSSLATKTRERLCRKMTQESKEVKGVETYRRKMCECEVVDVDASVLCCSWRKLVGL